MSVISYSLIKHESKVYFDINNSHSFNIQIQGNSYIQAFFDIDRETIEIYFSTDNQSMVITHENEKFNAYCHDSNANIHRSESIDNIAKTIFINFSMNFIKKNTMDEMVTALTKMFNEAESTVPTFEELDQ
jgi:hypothetical protein